jgi:hypothetical protein
MFAGWVCKAGGPAGHPQKVEKPVPGYFPVIGFASRFDSV